MNIDRIKFIILLPCVLLCISHLGHAEIGYEPFGFSQKRWNDMRKAIEDGRVPGEKMEVSTMSVQAIELPPPAPGAVVELPYESRLAITGRKLIGINLKYTKYDLPLENRTQEQTSMDMKQELQVKIKGQVAKKISVNVDFDDTVADKRDISVVYRGDPDEFIQDLSFGDINMSLPGTEFVGYSKQAFGIKLVTKRKGWNATYIASQSKGTPETKRFTGYTKLERPTIYDTSYVEKRYYKLSFGTDAVKEGTEIIYRDDRNSTNDQNAIPVSYSSYTAALQTFSTGYFDRLLPGQDYTVDYPKGIIILKNTVQTNHVIIVNYQKKDGKFLNTSLGTTNYILIKDELNTRNVETGPSRELKNFYNIGKTQILRDNGRGNFFLKVVDPAGNDVSSIDGKPVPVYPKHLVMDFEAGLFYILDDTQKIWHPFKDSAYASSKQSSYRFFIEYRWRSKTLSLRPGILPQSEVILMDNRMLTRDVDYFIDYDIGILTILDESRITDTTVIDASYEYTLFGLGTQIGETFLGTRQELSLTQNLFIGASFMQNFPARPQTIPDFKSAPQDLMVGEVDTRVSGLSFGPFGVGFGGEYAFSARNMNVFGRAMVESMENIKQEDGPSLYRESWKFSATSEKHPYPYNANWISWNNTDVSIKEIYGIKLLRDEQQKVLNINYNLKSGTAAAIVQSLSPVGLDFSRKIYLEMQLKLTSPNLQNAYLVVEMGRLNEDADRDGVFDTEDTIRNGVLNEGEDIGWKFTNPDGADRLVDGGNGLIDSEDLDGNGFFETFDNVVEGENGRFTISLSTEAVSDKWVYIKKDIKITDPSQWTYVKQVRITVYAPGQEGSIAIAKLNFSGNKWENLTPGALKIYSVSNFDDTEYSKNSLIDKERETYEKVYGPLLIEDDTTRKEQSLKLEYDFETYTTSPVAVARLSYLRGMDFSTHKYLKFFVYGSGNNETLRLRFLTDDNNYLEYGVKVDWNGRWKLLSIHQSDETGDSVPDRWIVGDRDIKANITSKGTPSFLNITQIQLIVSTATELGTANSPKSYLWVNEIHLTDSFQRKGEAARFYTSLSLPGWFDTGASYKNIGAAFETFNQPITNRELKEESAYFNFKRLSFMPISVSGGRSETTTPSLERSGELVAAIEQDSVIKHNLFASTNISLWKLPRIGGSYSVTISSISNRPQKIFRTDEQSTVSTNLDWGIPRILKFDLIDSLYPTSINASASRTTTLICPWDVVLSTTNPVRDEKSDTIAARAPFNIWKRITLNPSYSQTMTYEEKRIEPLISYEKSRNQLVGMGSSIRVFRWFMPSANYSVNTTETYNFGELDPAKISKLKTVTRSSSGDLSVSFGIGEIVRFRPVRTLNLSQSFSIQDYDKYDNLPSTFSALGPSAGIKDTNELISDTIDKLNVRKMFDPEKLVQLTKRDNWRMAGRWNVLEGFPFPSRFEPLKRMNVSGTNTETSEYSYITGTQIRKYIRVWPDLILSFYDTEKILGVQRVISDSRVSIKTFSKVDNSYGFVSDDWAQQGKGEELRNNLDTSFNIYKKYSMSVSYGESMGRSKIYLPVEKTTSLSRSYEYSLQFGFEFRRIKITPGYSFRDDKAWAGDPAVERDVREKPTQDLRTHTANLQLYANTSLPGGLRIPLVGKTLPLVNNFIFNGNYTYIDKDTDLGDVSKNKTTQHNVGLSVDYEASSNIRVTVGSGWTRFINKKVDKENYSSYNISGQLTLVF